MKKIIHLISFLAEQERRKLKRLAVLCLFSPVADLFSVSMIIPIFNQAFDEEVSPELISRILFLGGVLLLTGGFELLKSRASHSLVADITNNWSVKIYELYCKEDLERHNRKTPIQAVNNARSDVAVCAGMIPAAMELAVDFLTLAAYFLIIVYVAQAVGALCCLLTVLIMLLLYRRNRIGMARYGENRRRFEIKAGGLISTAYGSYKEIHIDARKQNMLDKYRRASADCAQVQKDFAFMLGLQGIVLQNVMQAGLFFILALVLVAGVDLAGILPEAVAYIALLIRMIPGSKRIVAALTNLQFGTKYYEAFRSDMQRYGALKKEEETAARLREKLVTLEKGIRVQNLSFCYPGGKKILEDASIEIPAGCSTALIGVSGAGKTTFLDLILGLLRPQSGHIWYDDFDLVQGRDAAGACRADIGRVVSYIPQIIYLDNETIRNNVIFMAQGDGRQEAPAAVDAKVISCLQCAQIWEDVEKMPDGIDTLVGQNGTTVSGGQRQRIALARALYKDFEILIMDEATAALDIETEKAVIDSIRQMKGNKTLLMVTHHLSLADECEHVYRIENQKLVKVR
ncbi:MAG: ABC transporter ATP-binding protein [Provencibacterium sp.]|jgi:ABC-type bacteriocin/lantibiotic exporter with double-glycine peptidase domain|nr:ABC transporter ATP-binding protein [Provencibacterium sp.]